MRILNRGSIALAVVGASVVGLFAFAQVYHSGAGPSVALAQPRVVYNAATGELPIPNPGDGTGNLQADAVCGPGDIALGGGHIVHPSGTTNMFITKSYATDATGGFTPYVGDGNRWRVKVLNPNDQAGKKLSVHVVCAKP